MFCSPILLNFLFFFKFYFNAVSPQSQSLPGRREMLRNSFCQLDRLNAPECIVKSEQGEGKSNPGEIWYCIVRLNKLSAGRIKST